MTRPVDPLCERLREIRQRAGLSLQQVQEKSAGRWKAVVVGSWERGDRTPTVRGARELLDFYGFRLEVLGPDDVVARHGADGGSSVDYFVVYGGGSIPCADFSEAEAIASHMPGSRVAYRTRTVGDLVLVGAS